MFTLLVPSLFGKVIVRRKAGNMLLAAISMLDAMIDILCITAILNSLKDM